VGDWVISTLWKVRFDLRLLALVCAALLAPASASAQSNDPAAGSPSGSIYEIPLEGARSDAAPGGSRRGEGSSPIRSENGFGSSPAVPGAPETGAGDAAGAAAGGSSDVEPAGGGTGGDASSGGSGGTSGAGSEDAAGTAPAESDVPEGRQTRDSGAVVRQAAGTSPSVPRALLLVGLGLLVAAGLAAGIRLADRRG
jgi:hypothetical protein